MGTILERETGHQRLFQHSDPNRRNQPLTHLVNVTNPLDQPVEYFRVAVVTFTLALKIACPNTHQPDLLFEIYSFQAGVCRFSYLFFRIGIIRDRHRPRNQLFLNQCGKSYYFRAMLVSYFVHGLVNSFVFIVLHLVFHLIKK